MRAAPGSATLESPRDLDLADEVSSALDRRLQITSPRPVAVAFSGGGDSLALLLTAHAWARRAGRPLLALTVDHRLQPRSVAWTEACAARATALGVGFRALAWTGDKPAAGLPAAARAARHRLLAEAAREAGARVILIGHTADDVAEARAMRAAGATTPEPRVWSPSPAWPQGRGLFLLRPLLGARRADIRAWLQARNETWIEDPANRDPRFARARARASLADDAPLEGAPADLPGDLALACEPTDDGGLAISRQVLTPAPLAARFLAFAALCAAGTWRPPASRRVQRLLEHLRTGEAFTASLSGARITADAHEVRFLREAGERARGGLQPLALAPGRAAVWDGRFELVADRPLEVRALAGLAARLSPSERRAIASLPATARPALPAVIEAGVVRCPLLAPIDGLAIRPLAHERLLAACGVVEREPD